MPERQSINFGGREFAIQALPLKRVTKLVSHFNRVVAAMEGGRMTDASLDAMIDAISVGLDVPREGLDELPTTIPEIAEALAVLVRVSGYDEAMRQELSGVAAASVAAATST
ncbi:hypothetical protein [Rubrivivax sp. JA1026]|uniref:hypothetical protein n=1 Tax=Rubrivivax sp. JA1026 TaxID=2710888 RepID=UPI0013E9251E|nr:hypothetical protein [Rubrivivax sp. JA1026]